MRCDEYLLREFRVELCRPNVVSIRNTMVRVNAIISEHDRRGRAQRSGFFHNIHSGRTNFRVVGVRDRETRVGSVCGRMFREIARVSVFASDIRHNHLRGSVCRRRDRAHTLTVCGMSQETHVATMIILSLDHFLFILLIDDRLAGLPCMEPVIKRVFIGDIVFRYVAVGGSRVVGGAEDWALRGSGNAVDRARASFKDSAAEGHFHDRGLVRGSGGCGAVAGEDCISCGGGRCRCCFGKKEVELIILRRWSGRNFGEISDHSTKGVCNNLRKTKR